MVTEADGIPEAADLKPYVDIAYLHLVPRDACSGSDWPVCELAGGYSEVCGALSRASESLSATEKAQLFGGTASSFYRLDR